MASLSTHDLHIVPLGAGDLIDRAVRLYRRHLFVLIRIAAPPVFVSALGSVLWTIAFRKLFATPSGTELAVYLLIGAAGIFLWIGGHLFSLIVIGGASRNLVRHLLWNEPVLARTTYSAVRSRFWSLFGASIIVMLWLGVASSVASFGSYMVILIVILGGALMAQWAPIWLTAISPLVGS